MSTAYSQSAVTPYRDTTIFVDTPEFVLTEPPFAMTRTAAQISAVVAHVGGDFTVNMELLATGCYIAQPLQSRLGNIHERSDDFNALLRLAYWTYAASIGGRNLFRKPADLTGVTFDSHVQANGDEFITKVVTAGQSWNQSLTADAAAEAAPTLPTANMTMDRVMVTKSVYPADQPILLRFTLPGTTGHSPDSVLTFYFGGGTQEDGAGRFCINISGDGHALLYEKVWGEWLKRDEWVIGDAQSFGDATHYLRVIPHINPTGTAGFLEFYSGANANSTSYQDLHSGYIAPNAAPRSHVYSTKFTPGSGRQNMTGVGTIKCDMRRDLKPHVQFSLVRFEDVGLLVDLPFYVDHPVTGRADFTLNWTQVTPAGTSIVGRLFDANTNVELDETDRGTNYATYTPNVNVQHYYAQFEFYADPTQARTPFFWGASVTCPGYIDQTKTTPFIMKGSHIAISGPEADPSHETASLTVHDPTDSFYSLRRRSKQAITIATAYDPIDPLLTSALFTGYIGRAEATKRGTIGTAWPNENWHDYQITCTGAWARLQESMVGIMYPLGSDPAYPTLAYKVTDVIRLFLQYAGYPYNPDDLPSSMVDVPDLPIRFFGADAHDLFADPLTNISEFVVEALKRYLGAVLTWDANAGLYGKWRVFLPPQAPYRNLASFTTVGPGVAGALVHRPESYGSANWVSYSGEMLYAPVTKHYRSYSIAPEANCVTVSGTGALKGKDVQLVQSMVNPDSYDFGTTQTAFPDSDINPDYVGRRIPIVIVDPTLTTQEAVDWVCRRVFDVTCHGRKIIPFEAPLLLVRDPYDDQQVQPRPLGYYDGVLFNGTQLLIRTCNPTYTKDDIQMADYECEVPVTLTT